MANTNGTDELALLLRHRIIRAEQAGLRQINITLFDLGKLLDRCDLAKPAAVAELSALELRVARLELITAVSGPASCEAERIARPKEATR